MQAFHASGRYLLSAGIDCSVNLVRRLHLDPLFVGRRFVRRLREQWALPVLPNADTGTDHPTTIHFPHFSSSAVHSDYIDWYEALTVRPLVYPLT